MSLTLKRLEDYGLEGRFTRAVLIHISVILHICNLLARNMVADILKCASMHELEITALVLALDARRHLWQSA